MWRRKWFGIRSIDEIAVGQMVIMEDLDITTVRRTGDKAIE